MPNISTDLEVGQIADSEKRRPNADFENGTKRRNVKLAQNHRFLIIMIANCVSFQEDKISFLTIVAYWYSYRSLASKLQIY